MEFKTLVLENLKLLRDNMIQNDWIIACFVFYYKKIEYTVLVRRFVETMKKKNKYALVELHFIKSNNFSKELIVEANGSGLLIAPKTLREYFGIEYGENLGDILKQFSENLNKFIPTKIPLKYPSEQRNLMAYSLSKSDSENPNKVFCYKVRRNPKGQKRTAFNSEKTKLLRIDLYKEFYDDKSISFCYSEDKNMEKSTSEILNNFAKE